MDSPPSGMAYFSTKGGQCPPRPAPALSSRFMIRGDLQDRNVRDSFIATLRRDFPDKCKEIRVTPGSSRDIHEYFDGFDISLRGPEYLNAVLERITWENVTRIRDLEAFVQDWKSKNEEQFWHITRDSTSREVFHEEDLEAYGEAWLGDALERILLRRDCHIGGEGT